MLFASLLFSSLLVSQPWPRYFLAYHRRHSLTDNIVDSVHLLVEVDERNKFVRIGEALFQADTVKEQCIEHGSEKEYIHSVGQRDWFRIYIDHHPGWRDAYKMTVIAKGTTFIYDLKPMPELAK